MFKGILLTKDNGGFRAQVAEIEEKDLPEGDVSVRVEYSTINYKDGLAIANKSPVVRKWPMVAGIDGAGAVVRSSHGDWKPGDKFIINGWGLGETHWGCLAQKARLSGDWLVPLPATFTTQQAMAIGTAGYAAMLCVLALEAHGVTSVRESNVSNRVSFDKQLKVERVGELQSLLSQSIEILENYSKTEEEERNSFFGYIELGKRVRDWADLGGQPPDLFGYIEFYKSEHNTKCPHIDLGANLFAKIMTDPQPIRSGDPMDIQHMATLMPYSDLFITDKAWSTFLNRSGFAGKYGTKVCYIGNIDEIAKFFESLA